MIAVDDVVANIDSPEWRARTLLDGLKRGV